MITINSIPDPLIECDFKNVYYPSDDSYLLVDYFRKNINDDLFDGIKLEEIEYVLDLGYLLDINGDTIYDTFFPTT